MTSLLSRTGITYARTRTFLAAWLLHSCPLDLAHQHNAISAPAKIRTAHTLGGPGKHTAHPPAHESAAVHRSATMSTITRVDANSLYVSEPNPSWFGNGPNEQNNPKWTNANWLKSRFHFSFAEYHDAKRCVFTAFMPVPLRELCLNTESYVHENGVVKSTLTRHRRHLRTIHPDADPALGFCGL